MRTNAANICRLLAGAALLACISLPGGRAVHAQDAPLPVLEDARQLSMLSFENSNPAVAFSPDGSRLFVAWDGLVEGNRRILMREQVAGEWLKTVIVDNNPAGDNRFPSIAVDKSGTPHVSWISTVAGKRSPMYARRFSRFPNLWYRQPIPFPEDSTVSGNSDFVNLQLDDSGQPWIVWQYGTGNVYSIAVTRYNEDGKLTSIELTPGATTHNLYPELFFLPQPTVYWYLAQSDQFYLIGSQLNPEIGKWRVALPENLENVPADTLPDLFRTSRGPLAAIWYEHGQAGADISTDRVFLGIQSEETHGGGEVIDEQPAAENHSVAGAASYNTLITAWISETYEDGANVFLGLGDSPNAISSVKMSDDEYGIGSNPKVAGSADRAAVAWEEKEGPGSPSSEILVRVVELAE